MDPTLDNDDNFARVHDVPSSFNEDAHSHIDPSDEAQGDDSLPKEKQIASNDDNKDDDYHTMNYEGGD